MSWVTVILTIVSFNGIFLALVYLLAKYWLSVEIENSVTLRYKKRFEGFKSQLQSEHDVKLQQLEKALSLSGEAFIQGQRVSVEQRINAATVLWRGIRDLKRTQQQALRTLDFLTPEEYDQMRTNAEYRRLVDEMTIMTNEEFREKMCEDEVEMVRPFLEYSCYSLYASYRFAMHVIPFLLKYDITRNQEVQPWFNHTSLPELVATVLDDDDIVKFHSLPVLYLDRFSEIVELKILHQLSGMIAGGQSADEGLYTALKNQSILQSEFTRIAASTDGEESARHDQTC